MGVSLRHGNWLQELRTTMMMSIDAEVVKAKMYLIFVNKTGNVRAKLHRRAFA